MDPNEKKEKRNLFFIKAQYTITNYNQYIFTNRAKTKIKIA